MKSREEVNLGEVLPRFQAGGEGLFLVLKLLTVSKHRRENRNGGRSSFHSAGESGGTGILCFHFRPRKAAQKSSSLYKIVQCYIAEILPCPWVFQTSQIVDV